MSVTVELSWGCVLPLTLVSHNLDPHKESAINEGTEAGTVTRNIINFTEFSLILCPGQFHTCCQGSRGLPHAATQPGGHTRQHASSVGHEHTAVPAALLDRGTRGQDRVFGPSRHHHEPLATALNRTQPGNPSRTMADAPCQGCQPKTLLETLSTE